MLRKNWETLFSIDFRQSDRVFILSLRFAWFGAVLKRDFQFNSENWWNSSTRFRHPLWIKSIHSPRANVLRTEKIPLDVILKRFRYPVVNCRQSIFCGFSENFPLFWLLWCRIAGMSSKTRRSKMTTDFYRLHWNCWSFLQQKGSGIYNYASTMTQRAINCVLSGKTLGSGFLNV